jgi:hypothetical protein
MLMAKNDVTPPGLETGKQTATEQDPDKVVELAQELIKKLDAQSAEELGKITPADKAERKTA